MKVEVNIPDGKSGEYEIKSFSVKKDELSQKISMMKTGRGVPEGDYKMLKRGGVIVMSNTPDEIRDAIGFVRQAKGHVLINGLGLGVVVNMLLAKEEVTKITVIEISKDVIDLVAPHITDPRFEVIHADCFEYRPPRGQKYDSAWHDIWDYITSDNLPEMAKLHRKYGRRVQYQESWCREECKR